jgi:pimeloyl-ACP methyl ester carboxylesterase
MATFVLVHGGWHGGWCWGAVATEMRAAGHEVFTPTRSGLAERARLADRADLSLHVDEVTGLLFFADLREVVLVGHSYAGLVISGAAARSGGRISRLVYLDAFVATDGESLFDVLRPERRDRLESSAQDGLVPAPSPEIFGITERREWVADRLTPQPLPTFTEKLNAPSEPRLPRLYVRCTQGPLSASFAGFATRLRDTEGCDVVDFDSGHDAMLTRPTDVAALLVT